MRQTPSARAAPVGLSTGAAWPRSERPLILAGGLTPDNVASAIAATRPYAVDVASGVEGATKGRKDAERVTRFIKAVANA